MTTSARLGRFLLGRGRLGTGEPPEPSAETGAPWDGAAYLNSALENTPRLWEAWVVA